MRKLNLEVDELKVESFETAWREEKTGTVRGNMPFQMPATDETGCGGGCGGGSGGYYSVDANSGCQSCPCTLKYSCWGSCDICTVIECPTQATGCCGP
jgi:hypothetical protein